MTAFGYIAKIKIPSLPWFYRLFQVSRMIRENVGARESFAMNDTGKVNRVLSMKVLACFVVEKTEGRIKPVI